MGLVVGLKEGDTLRVGSQVIGLQKVTPERFFLRVRGLIYQIEGRETVEILPLVKVRRGDKKHIHGGKYMRLFIEAPLDIRISRIPRKTYQDEE